MVLIVNKLLRPYALQIAGPYPRLICADDTLRDRRAPPDCHITIAVSPPVERLREVGAEKWPHAISRRSLTEGGSTTTALALASYGTTVAGVATIGADSEQLWQIGIDVAEEFRERGIGAALTARIARHALELGKVPWYGVAPANLASLNTALAAGFRPAWLEVFTAALDPPEVR
jgi:RimJ/RimL family protein N-acetyltransferase